MNAQDLQYLIQAHSPEARERIERTVKRWNQTLREKLRAETGLRMSWGNYTESVTVQIEDGASNKFSNVISKFEDWLPLLLSLPRLEAALSGLQIVEDNYQSIVENKLNVAGGEQLNIEYRADKNEIVRSKYFIRQTIENLKKQEILQNLGEINEDLLGAYFFYEKRIVIYWAPIALLADILGISIESLTVITLAHELAHAFTHLGYDIDGDNWQTEAFRNAELHICEGLAEWFTSEVISNFYESNYELIEAGEKLAAIYDEKSPYVIHQYWHGGIGATSEVVRLAMLKCRKLRMSKYEEFEKLLKDECSRMPKAKGNHASLF